MKSMENPHV
jgi:hypothetical protein